MLHTLREQLRQESPELFAFFERSEAIAEAQWFPAIGTNRGSFNSYPHVRNLENYLDLLLRDLDELPERRRPFVFRMNTLEKYILLSAILFHDIGRTHSNPECHAAESQKILKARHAELGIPNGQIANTLARICYAHDPEPEEWDTVQGALQETVIDPYGLVRERPLATLLYLVDHLDSAYTRTIPYYLPGDRAEAGALLRSNINGIRIDLNNQMVVVSIPNRSPNAYNPDKTEVKKAKDIVQLIEEKAEFKINEMMLEEIQSIPGLCVEGMMAFFFQTTIETLDKLKKQMEKSGQASVDPEFMSRVKDWFLHTTEYVSFAIALSAHEQYLRLQQLAIHQTLCNALGAYIISTKKASQDLIKAWKEPSKWKDFESLRHEAIDQEKCYEQIRAEGDMLIRNTFSEWEIVAIRAVEETCRVLESEFESVITLLRKMNHFLLSRCSQDRKKIFHSFEEQENGEDIRKRPVKSVLRSQAIYGRKLSLPRRSSDDAGTIECEEVAGAVLDIPCEQAFCAEEMWKTISRMGREGRDRIESKISEASTDISNACRSLKILDDLGSIFAESDIEVRITSDCYKRYRKSLERSMKEKLPSKLWKKAELKQIQQHLKYIETNETQICNGCKVDDNTSGVMNNNPLISRYSDAYEAIQTGLRAVREVLNRLKDRGDIEEEDEPTKYIRKIRASVEEYLAEEIAKQTSNNEQGTKGPQRTHIKYKMKNNEIRIKLLKTYKENDNTYATGDKLYCFCYEKDFLIDGYHFLEVSDIINESARTCAKEPHPQQKEDNNLENKWKDPSYELLRAADFIRKLGERCQAHSIALVYYLLSRGFFFCTNGGDIAAAEKPDQDQLSTALKAMLIPIIVSSARENGIALDKVAPDLAALGLPLQAWLLERNERLYNYGGFETHEPIFDKKYLKRVAAAMHDLWCGTLDLRPISYEYLAAELRETDLQRIKTAVRRIAIIGRYRETDADKPNHPLSGEPGDYSRPSIRHTLSGWSWLKSGLCLQAICERIDSLKDPREYLRVELEDAMPKGKPEEQGVEEQDEIRLGAPLDQLFNSACRWPFMLKNTNGTDNTVSYGGVGGRQRGGLRKPSRQNPGTGNIIIVGKAGTGKSTLAMQILTRAVTQNLGIYGAYFSLEESRAHVFSKADKFGWTPLLTPLNIPQNEAYNRDLKTLCADLRTALHGHYCRETDALAPTDACKNENICEFAKFCSNLRNNKNSNAHGKVLLPKLLPFSFGEKYNAADSDKLFHDRFHQIKAFLDAALELRDDSKGGKDIRVVCVDSLNVLGRGGMTRDHLSSLFDLFKRHNVIGLFVLEDAERGTFAGQSELDQETIEFLADMTIELTGREEDGYWVRHFQIKKSRYQQQILGRHPFKIRSLHTDGKDAVQRPTLHEDKAIVGLHVFPSTHHINAVLSSGSGQKGTESNSKEAHQPPSSPEKKAVEQDKKKELELEKIWTNRDLDTLLIPGAKIIDNKKEDKAERDKNGVHPSSIAHSIFTIVGPATSGKSILAKNYLLQGINQEQGGHSLLIRLAVNCEDKDLRTFFFPESSEDVKDKDKPLKYNPFDTLHPVKTNIPDYLAAVDQSKYECIVYSRCNGMNAAKRNTPLFISIALKSGFLLPEEFFETILLMFEWQKKCSDLPIRRVVLYDVSAIGHSYPLLRSSSTDCDLFLSSLVQFFRFQRTGFMMCATRSGVPESETVVEKVISLADFVIESNHLDVFGDRYITYTGPGAVDRELKGRHASAQEPVPGVLRKVYSENRERFCYQVNFKLLEGFVGFSTGNIRRPGVSLYLFQEKDLQRQYNKHIQKMLQWALAAPVREQQAIGPQFYPDVQFKPFDSSESEAFHNGLDLLKEHPLHRTVIRTIDEFAIDVVLGCDGSFEGDDGQKESPRAAAEAKAEAEATIYYKNVLILLMSSKIAEKWKNSGKSWKVLADCSKSHLCIPDEYTRFYYDTSAHETLVAGVLDALTQRTGFHDNIERVENLSMFDEALRFFRNAEEVDYKEGLPPGGEFVVLCWYTQARCLIKKTQDSGRPMEMFALPNDGFRGDWYLWVHPDSVSPPLGDQIVNKMLCYEEQMKRFLDGVGLPAWHRFIFTDRYLEGFDEKLDEKLREFYEAIPEPRKKIKMLEDALKKAGEDCLHSSSLVVTSSIDDRGIAEAYKVFAEYLAERNFPDKSFIQDVDRELPAFPGTEQKLYEILNIHADAKKRSEIPGSPRAGNDAATNKRKYKDIHAQLYAMIDAMVKSPEDASSKKSEALREAILELCGWAPK